MKIPSEAIGKLSQQEIDILTVYGSEESFAADEAVWDQGENQVSFFVVLKGAIEIFHDGIDVETKIHVHRDQEFAGDIDVVSGRAMVVGGRALEPTTVLANPAGKTSASDRRTLRYRMRRRLQTPQDSYRWRAC